MGKQTQIGWYVPLATGGELGSLNDAGIQVKLSCFQYSQHLTTEAAMHFKLENFNLA